MAERTQSGRTGGQRFARRTTRWIEAAEPDAGQRAARRLAEELRAIAALLLETAAPAALLEELAEEAGRLRERLAAEPGGRVRYRNESGGPAEPEPVFLDTSPLIGLVNPVAPPLRLSLDGETVHGVCVFGRAYEGPPGNVHGGFIAAAFDELLGATQSLSERPGMTGRLTVRYRRPVPLHREVVLTGRLLRVEGRKILTEATLTVDGVLHAEAEGLFVSVDPARLRGERAD
ncbi:MAG TPA: PaaI family thioesterase [Dehalococcoidia bacterium]|nr:PaaI family thioesterase [Dehalococcoidia bacterium]